MTQPPASQETLLHLVRMVQAANRVNQLRIQKEARVLNKALTSNK